MPVWTYYDAKFWNNGDTEWRRTLTCTRPIKLRSNVLASGDRELARFDLTTGKWTLARDGSQWDNVDFVQETEVA